MFQLDREIRIWCESVVAARCGSRSSVEELVDHLNCEIERLQQTGLSQEEAFEVARKRLGDAKLLMSKYDKNRSGLLRFCGDGAQKSVSSKQVALFTLVYSALFALTVFLLGGLLPSEQYDIVVTIMCFCWLVPLFSLPVLQGSNKCECAFFRRLFRRESKSNSQAF